VREKDNEAGLWVREVKTAMHTSYLSSHVITGFFLGGLKFFFGQSVAPRGWNTSSVTLLPKS
jgi:hypothetical protein